jgi:hypothetical protein
VRPRKQEELGRRSRVLPLPFPLRLFASPPPEPLDDAFAAAAEAPLLLPDPIPRHAMPTDPRSPAPLFGFHASCPRA